MEPPREEQDAGEEEEEKEEGGREGKGHFSTDGKGASRVIAFPDT